MKLNKYHKLALGVIGVAAVATTAYNSVHQTSRIAPSEAYPNAQLTVGKADTLSVADLTKDWTDNCPNQSPCTYSQDHRNVPPAEHTQVYEEYNVPQAQRNIQNGEIDHYYPLCAGGSNDISNLWYMPVSIPWNGENLGYKTKDKLESWICIQIKSGKMNPQDAYNQLTTDWVAMYENNKAAIEHQPLSFGSISYDYDGDN